MIKRATCYTWAEYLEKREGVKVSVVTIYRKLKEAGRLGQDGRDRLRRLLKNAYFSEQDVRDALASLLLPIPQADETGFFNVEGIRHGTVFAWSRDLGIPNTTVVRHLSQLSIPFLRGKDCGGHVQEYYPEPAIRTAFAELLRPLPRMGKFGFFLLGGIRHGAIGSWSCELGISMPTILSRLRDKNMGFVKGKGLEGKIQDCYSEPVVREACADLLRPLPKVDKSGFFVQGGVRYGKVRAWSGELGIPLASMGRLLRFASIECVQGRNLGGQLCSFYPEPAVREACKDLIGKRKGQGSNRESAIGNRKSKK